MKNIIRIRGVRSVKGGRLAVVAVVVAAGLAVVPGHADAAAPEVMPIRHPKLKEGLLTIEGTKRSDRLTLRLQAGDPRVLQLDVGDDGSADYDFARQDVARIELDAGDGDDLVRIDESNGAFSDIPTTIDGGAGADTLAGGSGAELLLGGDGNDSIDGNRGNDVAFMGAGDDNFVWDPGDGSDVVEGQDGADTMLFNGAAGPEQVDLSANGNRLRFFRTQGTITMDTRGVERVDFNALGGADTVTVNDLTGTDVTSVNVDLAGTIGGGAGDGSADRVIVNATNGRDAITVTGDAGGVKASGLAATVGVLHSEAASDRLEINTLAGTDSVDPAGLAAGAIQLVVDGVLVP
jgi:RTX calcium-binding nonapeptide repeat (4 copies)